MRNAIQFRVKTGLFFLIGIMALQTLHAQKQPPYTAIMNGDTMAIGKSLSIRDTVFYNPAFRPFILQTNKVSNIVSLRINEYGNRVLPDSFTADITVRLAYVNKDDLTDSVPSKVFRISYNKNRTYNSKDLFTLEGAYYMDVKILAINVTGASSATILPLLELENRMQVDRDYLMNPISNGQMNCSVNAIRTINSDASAISTTGELNISWVPNLTIESYDVEWTFIDKSALDNGRYNSNGQLDQRLIFQNNATRITTTSPSTSIPLLYDGEGSLFFHVRGVQVDASGEVMTTLWSSEFGSSGGLGRYDFKGHQTNLNWQATTSFAEDAKRKTVVQYYDGSLRSRQTVTRDNTTQTTVVAETLYDKQGRPVIQVLPAPTISKLIAYSPGLNAVDINGREFDKGNYDTVLSLSSYCADTTNALSTTNGAAKYYSGNNELSGLGYHQYIPNANGYVYTETQYAQDNSERITRQGGVGRDFRIGSGHETKYYYGTPDQSDLDALFGTEAGEASHYQKNMVRDANGQYSVSYVDMHGRTVATALAGEHPLNMQRLASNTSVRQTESLITKSNNVISGNKIVSTKSILVPRTGTYSFTYQQNGQSLSLEDCRNRNICYDCLYDLVITVTDDCNNQLLPGGQPLVIKKSNFSLFSIDTTCKVATPIHQDFQLTLQEGSYTITKELSVSQEGQAYYRDSIFASRNNCQTYVDILKEEMITVKTILNCAPPAEELADYQSYRKDMENDLIPQTGQYAQFPSNGCFSILNDRPLYVFYPRAYQELSNYRNEEGILDSVVNANGEKLPPQLLSPEEFIANFKTSWLKALILLHPEYEKLSKYESYTASLQWDQDFAKTETYRDAKNKGYLNPTGNNTQQPALRFGTAGKDPLFTGFPESNAARQAIETKLFSFQTFSTNNISVWGLSTSIAKFPNLNPLPQDSLLRYNQAANSFNENLLCETELDAAWRSFRDNYATIKKDWIMNSLQSVPDNAEVCSRVFSDSWSYLQNAGFTGTAQDSVTATTQANEFYASNCEGYAGQWWSQLTQGCTTYTEADKAVIIPYLIEVCKQGADSEHPFGSSSVNPASSNRFKSFDEVIRFYNDSTGRTTDAICNSYLINSPKPYNQQTMLIRKPLVNKPSDCECAQINTVYNQYLSQAATYGSFSNYMQQKYETRMSQGSLDSLRNLCNNTLICKVLAKPISIPPVFQCGVQNVCVSCIQVENEFNLFKMAFPGSLPNKEGEELNQQTINLTFANYMNQRFGFSKTYVDYLEFMDSCTVFNNTNGCKSLENILADYSNSGYRRGRMLHSFSSQEGENFNDLKQLIKNGAIQLPDSVRSRPGTWYNNYGINIMYGDRICTDNGYTAELRFKFLVNDLGGNIFYVNLGSNVSFVVSQYFGGSDRGGPVPNGIMISSVNDDQGNRYGYENTFNNQDLFTYLLDENPDAILNWMNFKVKVLPNAYYIYYNNRLIIEKPRNPGIAIGQQSYFGIGIRGRNGSIDWVKIADENENLKYFEDFENAENEAYVNTSFICPAPADCKTSFTNYYNQRKSTSYSFSQIDSIYFASCGKRLNVCGDNDSLIVSSSGIPKPAAISCDKLVNTYKNFLSDFPDPSKGAMVKDSLFQCKALFEWYFNMHLNTSNYTYEHITDWLVNSCGMKIKQLPCSDSVFVSRDTLQQIRSLFQMKYPDGLGNSITETILIPVHKITHITQRFRQSTGVFFDEYSSPSGASLSAMTWTGGGYWFNIRDNINFDFRSLPSNALINDASLNLYAKPNQIELFTCCGAHYRRTAQNIFGIFERANELVIPGITKWSNQPTTNITNSRTIAPISISNGVAGGGISFQIFSDEDYLNQHCTNLVKDMHMAAWQSKNYGLMFKLSQENINEYKAYTFWGITSFTPSGKQPNLNVNYTASRCDVFTAFVNVKLGTHMSTEQVQKLYSQKIGQTSTPCGITPPPDNPVPVPSNTLTLCGKTATLDEPFDFVQVSTCADSISIATAVATERYRIYQDSVKGSFDQAYMAKCLSAVNQEVFTMTYDVQEYHYTLYYYDLAGNLVKTVSPEGVRPNRDPAWLSQVRSKRILGQWQAPDHFLATEYTYNTLNQVVQQQTPDAGTSKFWYDRLGRLVVSQNAKQQADGKYSYTLYDAIGRITEVGQKPQPTPMTQNVSRDRTQLLNWLNYVYVTGSNRRTLAEQVTATAYDIQDNATKLPMAIAMPQKGYTLRNRVSYTRTYDMLYAAGTTGSTPRYSDYDFSTTYSYDIHGNVDTLMQQYRVGLMAAHGNNRFKLMAYRYDLISGKVNQVHYQPGQPDQFYHRYEYDAENRLTDVYTSQSKAMIGNDALEEHDAHYEYYKHGPLARVVLGQQQVQGLDYAYTLQGWLKGVNSMALDTARDMGSDGSRTLSPKDAFGFQLNYFTGDYQPINPQKTPFPGHSAYLGAAYRPLYNGNISSMAVNIGQFNQPQLYNYQYDQLNRIVSMDAYRGFNSAANNWNAITVTQDYKERISYDANGNILSYLRNGSTAGSKPQGMDNLVYGYNKDGNGNLQNNKLKEVKDDLILSGNYTEDIDSQPDNNYGYDAIGNLISDQAEKITNIEWSVYGKILSITKTATVTGDISKITYGYDPAGNRISKKVEARNQVDQYTWYVRDASGNVMAVYSLTGNNINTSTLNLSETHLYGSSRLGIFNRTVNMDVAPAGTGTANLLGITTSDNFARGNKFFELSNHLGNVLVTVSDRKFGQNPVNNLYTSFTADVVSATDYAPFGMQMVGRTFSAGSYRYGFGGQERSTELNNDSYTAEFWQYDARLGRRWNVDPKPKTYESAYMAFGGNPINVIDPNGADSVKVNGKWSGVWKSEKGNTLDGLAKAFGTSTKTIERLNPNTDFNNLSEGTNIRVQGETTIFGASDGALAVQQKGALEVTPLLNYKMNFLYNQIQQDGYINFMIESLGVTANISIANNSISAINIGIDGTQNQNVVIDNVNQLLNAFGLKVDMSLGIRIQPGIMNQASKDFNLTKTVVNGNYKRGYGWFGQIKPTVISEMQKASKGVSLQIQTYTNIMIESIRIMMASGNMHDWSGDDPDQITLKGDRFFSPGTNIYHKYLGVTIQKQ